MKNFIKLLQTTLTKKVEMSFGYLLSTVIVILTAMWLAFGVFTHYYDKTVSDAIKHPTEYIQKHNLNYD